MSGYAGMHLDEFIELKETVVNYADKLMQMASDAEAEASRLDALNAASGLDREQILAEIQYRQGQASGFRQAAYFFAREEGVNAYD